MPKRPKIAIELDIHHWSYRIMATKKGKKKTYAIHDVFYNSDMEVVGWSDALTDPYEDLKDMIAHLNDWIAEAQRAQMEPQEVLIYKAK